MLTIEELFKTPSNPSLSMIEGSIPGIFRDTFPLSPLSLSLCLCPCLSLLFISTPYEIISIWSLTLVIFLTDTMMGTFLGRIFHDLLKWIGRIKLPVEIVLGRKFDQLGRKLSDLRQLF